MTAEARVLRILRAKLDNEELIIRKLNSDITHVAPPPISNYWSDEYFGLGWASHSRHGKTKGHAYITDEHKEMIRTFFKLGEEDKGKKKSAALMVEAMKLEIGVGGTHPRQKTLHPGYIRNYTGDWSVIKHTNKTVNDVVVD